MADTRRMAQHVAAARAAGGIVRAVGDDAQISSPEAGGWFRLVAEDVAAPQLARLHRFTHAWEADASLKLRAGDPEAIHIYAAHGRILAGERDALEEAAYRAWRDDERIGRTSLLLVGTTARAAQLSARARADLVAIGKVKPDGVELHDGNLAGIGDRIVTRRNDSTNRDIDDRQVANRDHWIVRAQRRGRLVVERLDDATGQPTGRKIRLEADYVAADVELAYAAVKAARQGATVDTSHSLIDVNAALPTVYVAVTRGRHHNTLYVETRRTALPEDPNLLDTPEAVLGHILHTGRHTRPTSAHQAIRDAQNNATSLWLLGPIWEDTVVAATQQSAISALQAAGGEALTSAAQHDPAWPSLLAELHHAASTRGLDIGKLLAAAVTERDFHDARGVAAVLHYRITKLASTATDDNPPPAVWPSYRQRTPSGDNPDLTVARQAAELLDTRLEQLRSELASDPPDWTARVLGPVPADPIDRENWTHRAAAIAAYRERYRITTTHHTDTGTGSDAATNLLGNRPHPSRREAALSWEHAHAALGQASELNRLRAATDDELRAAIAASRAAEAAEPPYAGEELRAAAIHFRTAQTAEADLRTHIEAASHDTAELNNALAARQHTTTVAQRRYEAAQAAHDRWQTWHQHTAATRRTGKLATELLTSRTAHRTTATQPTPAGARLTQLAAAEQEATQRTTARQRIQPPPTRKEPDPRENPNPQPPIPGADRTPDY
jgi:hypothetical protein